jgi:hypothetical protein
MVETRRKSCRKIACTIPRNTKGNIFGWNADITLCGQEQNVNKSEIQFQSCWGRISRTEMTTAENGSEIRMILYTNVSTVQSQMAD